MTTVSKNKLELAEAKFMSTLDEVYDKLDADKFEVFVKSQNRHIGLIDFLEEAKINANVPFNNNSFSPKTVLKDCFGILENLGMELTGMKQRLETNIRSVIDILEEYSARNEDLQTDLDETIEENEKISNQNDEYIEQIKVLKKELKDKQAGILPLVDDVKNFFSTFGEKLLKYKDYVNDKTKFNVLQKDIDVSLKFFQLRVSEVINSKILDYDSAIKIYSEEEEVDIPIAEIVKEEFEEQVEIPERYRKYPPELYYKALDLVKRKKTWGDEKYYAEVERKIMNLERVKK